MGFSKLTAAKASGFGQRHVPTIGVRREVGNKLLSRNHSLALNAGRNGTLPVIDGAWPGRSGRPAHPAGRHDGTWVWLFSSEGHAAGAGLPW
jgi:hypothetical protein